MTTTVVKTIGSGGDYPTLQAWEDACPADLTSVDQIWQGQCLNTGTFSTASGVLLTMSGPVTDATRYMELTTAPGASFRDNAGVQTNALAFNSSAGAALLSSAGYAYIISCAVDFTRISNLQIKCSHAQGRGVNMGAAGSGTATCDVNNCIIEGLTANSAVSIAPLAMFGGNQVVRNSVIIQRGAGQTNIISLKNGAKAYNCTIVCPSDKTKATAVNAGAYTAATFQNCALFGGTSIDSGTAPTLTTCFTDVASPPAGATTATYANCFQGTTDAAQDWRLKSGSPLIDTGTTDSTHAATDIAGTARPSGSAYDVGAWELVAASGTTVSITGQRVTSAQGSLGARSVGVALTGRRMTLAQGAVTASVGGDKTVSITGLAITAASGVVGTVHLANVTGLSAATAQGALGTDHDVAVAGAAIASTPGVLVPNPNGDVTVSIGGLSMTLTGGAVGAVRDVKLTGIVANLRTGTLTASGGTTQVWTKVPPGHGGWKHAG